MNIKIIIYIISKNSFKPRTRIITNIIIIKLKKMITTETKGKKDTSEAKSGLENADKVINKGVMGWITRLFMGKKFTNDMNQTLAMGNDTLEMIDKRNELLRTGRDATAIVLTIEDTGKLINYDPIVKIKLNVMSDVSGSFEVETEQIVSKIAIPRVGDRVNIKYNPNNTKELIIL
jgi:hypothetical protein